MVKAIFLPTKPKEPARVSFFYLPETLGKLIFHRLDA
jgi:hypothetical protein